jgi:hypothetical protein
MIALHSDYLLFQLNSGESVPCSADMISIEIVGETGHHLDPEMLRHAAASVFHYFKTELACETVTIGEFSLALEKALRHLGYTIHAGETAAGSRHATDLAGIARDAADNLELFFFPRLRKELRLQLRQTPGLVRFHGLRGCAKQLAGAQRWSRRCEKVQDQIVEFLRGCLTAEPEKNECALVVE